MKEGKASAGVFVVQPVGRKVLRQKVMFLLGGVILLYVGLVATHKGEFWPFSIYQMFSSAGRTWTRVEIRDLSQDSISVSWDKIQTADLPGNRLSLGQLGLTSSQNDLAVFLEHAVPWSKQKEDFFQSVFLEKVASGQSVGVYAIQGQLTELKIEMSATLMAKISGNAFEFRPNPSGGELDD